MIRRWDVIVIAALLIVAILVGFLCFREPGAILIVEINGVVAEEIRLSGIKSVQTREYCSGDSHITICYDAESAWIAESDCPNHLCVRSGKITKNGQCVLCLPLRVCLRLRGDGETIDGVTG